MPFIYRPRRKNPPIARMGSSGFPKGWNSLPHASSLKDTELAELTNGVYSQYGTISKRQGSAFLGTAAAGATRVVNGGTFYNIGGSDYTIRITDTGKVEKYNFSTETWSLLTGTPPAGYSGTDPEFVSNSPVFDPSVYINIVQTNGKIYFASKEDRVTIFDGSVWKVYADIPNPTTKVTVAKTGSGTGVRNYYYRYVDMNEFGHTAGSPINTVSDSSGTGFYGSMPTLDKDATTYLTITLPAAGAGTTKRALYRGDTIGNEFFLAELTASQTVYVDKNLNPKGQEGVSFVYLIPSVNTTPGYHFYLLEGFSNSLVGVSVEEGKDTLLISAGDELIDSFATTDGASFDIYHQGDGEAINALQAFSVANKDGLAVFKDTRTGLMDFDPAGGINIQNVNVVRGTVSPMSPHVAGNNVRFYSSEGVASLGHEQNYGTILRYTVMSLKADSVTRQVNPANLSKVCSEYYQNLSLFGISTGISSSGNDSILVYDERYDTWSYWTGLHPAVFFRGIHPTTKVESLYFGTSATKEIGAIIKMFTGKTDYAASGSSSGMKISLSITTKQYDAGIPDKFKKYDKVVLVFGSLFGNGTTVQAFSMGVNGYESYPRYRISTDPVLSGFGNDEWGNQEVGMMQQDNPGNTLNLKYMNLKQKDLFWVKLNLFNDGIEDEVSFIGCFFYYTASNRQLPSSTQLKTLA